MYFEKDESKFNFTNPFVGLGVTLNSMIDELALIPTEFVTSMVLVAEPPQPSGVKNEYVMVCTPNPATAGLNTPFVTPGPEYDPPAGKPPVKVRGDAEGLIGANESNVTTG